MHINDAFEKSWINYIRCTKGQPGLANVKNNHHQGTSSGEGEPEDRAVGAQSSAIPGSSGEVPRSN